MTHGTGTATARAHVVVGGIVQGVWFRASTQDTARSLDIQGWVRNLPGGEVEVVFEGERARVEQAIHWCRHGPAGARVDRCEVRWESPRGESGFRIVR